MLNRQRMFYFKPLLWLVTIVGACLLSLTTSFAAGLKGSKHDLGSGEDNKSAVCAFCHAPDVGSDTSQSGETIMPLWNKSLTEIKSFKTYDSLGMSMGSGTASSGSVSIACLSCHDGTQAPDINMNPSGSTTSFIDNEYLGQRDDNRQVHPFSVPYKGNEISAIDFRAPSKLNINGSPVWWVDSGIMGQVITIAGNILSTQTGQREKTDIQLYSQSLVTNQFQENITVPFVECASCHNPHNSETNTFLRFDNNNSALCLSCHIK